VFRGLCWISASQALKPFSSSYCRQFRYLVSLAPGPSPQPDLSSRKRDSSAWGSETNDIPASWGGVDSKHGPSSDDLRQSSSSSTQTRVRIAYDLSDKVQSNFRILRVKENCMP
jgi:hypothetical protein